MPPRAPQSLPPPPRPDPVTLELIYNRLTSADVSFDDRAYHLVALYTIAFHPTVKLFLFEHTPLSSINKLSLINNQNEQETAQDEKDKKKENQMIILAENRRRREALLKSIAFFFAQRSNAVALECRWETISLLGELCRMENTKQFRSAGERVNNNNKNNNNNNNNISPEQDVVQRINAYAKENLEFLALLPWFVPAVKELIGGEENDKNKESNNKTTSSLQTNNNNNNNESENTDVSSSLEALREARRRRRAELSGRNLNNNNNNCNNSNKEGEEEEGVMERDVDVRIALQDLLNALPDVERHTIKNENETKVEPQIIWTSERFEHAQDLMFIDATTTMLHLIPLVTQSSHLQCAHCEKQSPIVNNNNNNNNNNSSFLRCGSCKAVYYCGAECQRAHWAAAHRVPCKTYKQCCDAIAAQYHSMNASHNGGKKQKKNNNNNNNNEKISVLEVPLEPSLFFATRRYLYDHRDTSFANVPFDEYFMKYTVRGN